MMRNKCEKENERDKIGVYRKERKKRGVEAERQTGGRTREAARRVSLLFPFSS